MNRTTPLNTPRMIYHWKEEQKGIWSVISEFPYLLVVQSYGAVSATVQSLARLMHNYLCPEFALGLVVRGGGGDFCAPFWFCLSIYLSMYVCIYVSIIWKIQIFGKCRNFVSRSHFLFNFYSREQRDEIPALSKLIYLIKKASLVEYVDQKIFSRRYNIQD